MMEIDLYIWGLLTYSSDRIICTVNLLSYFLSCWWIGSFLHLL